MSKDTPSDKHSSHLTFSSSAATKSAKYKRKNEAQKLEQESLAFLDIDSDTLHTGSRQLRSQRTLFMSDEDTIRKEVERGRLIDEEITYRPLRPGQKELMKDLNLKEKILNIFIPILMKYVVKFGLQILKLGYSL